MQGAARDVVSLGRILLTCWRGAIGDPDLGEEELDDYPAVRGIIRRMVARDRSRTPDATTVAAIL